MAAVRGHSAALPGLCASPFRRQVTVPMMGVMVTIPEVRRVGGLVGAELRGPELTKDYADETYEAVLRVLAGSSKPIPAA